MNNTKHFRPLSLMVLAAAAALVACNGITGVGGNDPCFDADKTVVGDATTPGDVRIHLVNDTQTTGMTAVFNANGQNQTCDPVLTDPATPTNVVFRLGVGDDVQVSFSADGNQPITHTCYLSADAFGEAVGTPGNAWIGVFMGAQESSVTCETGFEFSGITAP